MTDRVPESIASGNAKNEPINQQGSHGSAHARAEGGKAEIHDRIGLLLGIVALVISAATATYVVVKVDALKDQYIKTDTECGVLNDEVHEIKGALHGK